MAVTVGRDVNDQADVELGPPVHHRLGVLGHLPVQIRDCRVVLCRNGVEVAGGNAPAAAHALAVVDGGLPVLPIGDGVLGALFGALAATHAALGGDVGLSCRVLFHLAPAASAAHADVLDGPAEAGHLMALEVAQADEDVRVHDGPADLGGLHILPALNRDLDVVAPLQAVGDDHLTAGRVGGEAVLIGALNVLQGVFPPPGVQGVAVGQERQAAQGLDHVGHPLGVVGPQVGQVARLPEVDLDGGHLVVKVDVADSGGADQLLQLVQLADADLGAQVGEINFGCWHLGSLLTFFELAKILFYWSEAGKDNAPLGLDHPRHNGAEGARHDQNDPQQHIQRDLLPVEGPGQHRGQGWLEEIDQRDNTGRLVPMAMK